MFRLQRIRTIAPLFSRRTPSAPFRRGIRYTAASDDAVVQRVRIQRPAFTLRRAITPLVYAGTAYFVFTVLSAVLLPDDPDSADTPASNGNHQHDEDEEWDEDDTWFIPLGLWAKERPREYYRGSDPEWQEFSKFSKDPKRHKRAREQLVSIIRNLVARDPRFKALLGNVDVTRGNYWLDISFPDGPPLEYERSGIEIAPDGIRWTTSTVTARNYQRFNKVIWPSAAFFGLYESGKHVFQIHYNQMRELLGLPDQTDSKPPTVQDAFRKLASPVADSSDSTKRTASAPAKPPSSRGAEPGSQKEKNLGKVDFSPNAIDLTTFHYFMKTFVQRWRGFKSEPPRGTIALKGLIAVHGDRGRATLQVVGHYDPKSEKYVGLGAQVATLQPKQQRPKGGP